MAMSASANVQTLMKGVIGVSPTLSKTRTDHIESREFVQRFISQENTLTTESDGTTVCNSNKDDDNKEYLYMDRLDGRSSSPLSCVGVDFSSMAKDGSDISNLAMYAYDATYAMARAIHVVMYDRRATDITGEMIMSALIQNVSFTGVTGEISFSKGMEGGDNYGRGDRLVSMDYTIYNFDPRAYHVFYDGGISAWHKVGIFTAENTVEMCDVRYDHQCSDWVFNTRDGSPPIDEAPVREVQLDDAAVMGLRVAGSLTLVVVLFFIAVLELCKETRLIKTSQPAMMKMVLFGACLACIRVLLATIDITDTTCIVGKWLGHLSFAFVFMALVLKVWRVDAVVNSGFRKVKVTTVQIQRMLGMAMALFCVYLAADTIYSKPHRSYDESFDGHTTIRLIKCANESQTMSLVLYVIEGVLLVAGARLCWSTRDVPDAVNESRYIAMAMYVIVFVCAVIFPIVYLKIDPTPAILLTVMAVGYVIATLGCVLLLFGPKTALLWIGADVDESFTIVKRIDGFPPTGDANGPSTNGLVALRDKISSQASRQGSEIREVVGSVNGRKESRLSQNESVILEPKSPTVKNVRAGSKKFGKVGWANDNATPAARESVPIRVSEQVLPSQVESFNQVVDSHDIGR
eukprot:gene34899-45165_t